MLRKLAAATVAAVLAWPVSAQDTYNIGLTGALTGPPASTYAPAVEALRVYLERVNAAGGIGGKKINLILQDDSAEPGKATANAKKLLTQDNVILLINASKLFSKGRPKNYLEDQHVERIAQVYHDWKAEEGLSAMRKPIGS